MPKTVIALVGKAGSGKDTLKKAILEKYPTAHRIISCTTRPMRENEIEGVDYHFLTNEEMAIKILNGDMLEVAEFNSWMYGTLLSDLKEDKINVGIFNPEGFLNINVSNELNIIGIYLQVPDKVRMLRQLNREENPNVSEIARRFTTDEEDFSEFDNSATRPINLIPVNCINLEDLNDIVEGLAPVFLE